MIATEIALRNPRSAIARNGEDRKDAVGTELVVELA